MKQKLLFTVFACSLFVQSLFAQNAYIYVHQKTLNEQAAVDFPYTLTGTTTASFSLNNNPAWIQIGDIGAGHGTTASGNGDGEVWIIGNSSSASYNVAAAGLTGGIYRRPSASAQWSATNVTTGILAIDGAYYNQCVYVNSSGNVYFYYNGTSTQIYSGGNATDVTAGGGVIAIVENGAIQVYNKQYVAGASINTSNGAWTTVSGGGLNATTSTRIDFNLGGTSLLSSYVNGTTETLYTTGITLSGGTGSTAGTVTKGSVATANTFTTSTDSYGNTVGGNAGNPDVCYDDKGYIYALAGSQIYNAGDAVYSNTSGSYVYEPQSRAVQRISGSSGGQVWGVIADGTANTIWARNTDGTHIWIDDERVRVSGVGYTYKTGGGTGSGNTNSAAGVSNGNAIMIPVVAGTYTLSETLPDATWDLGRFTTYTPATSSISTSTSNRTATITVAAGDVVHVEFFNEKLSPKAIALTCTASVLEDFGTDGTGTNTFGDTVQGTAYHYYPQGNGTPSGATSPQDGKYYTVKDLTHWFVNPTLQSHSNAGTGYFLVVNASYATDEFYRKRVTNLVPGLQYTISFYAANINYTGYSTPATQDVRIPPNVSYGLQDANGNVVTSASTGSIDSLGATITGNTGANKWTLYSFTFTATTSQADFFLRNNTIGGLGNDIALDDISLNPVITPLPAIKVSPTIAPNVCIGTNYTFSNTQSGGVWTANPTTVASINAKTGKAKGLIAGTAVITYTYTNAIGCVSTNTTGIIVSAAPTVTTSDLLGNTSCLNQKDSLYSTPSSGTTPYSYLWSEADALGTGGLGSTTTQNTTVLPTASGSYSFNVLVTDAVGCTASGSVALTVSGNIAPTVTASSTGPYCTSASFALSSSATGGSGTYTYTWSASPTGNGLGTTNTKNTTATPTASGTYAYKVVVNDGFCNVPAFVSTTVTTTPVVTVTGPSGTQSLCNNGTIALASNLTTSGTAPVTFAWTGSFVSGPTASPNAGLQSPTTGQTAVAKPTLTSATSGNPDTYNYALTVTDAKGCTASANTNVKAYTNALSANFTASASSSPSAPVTLCSGTSISLSSSYSGSLLGTPSYAWTGPGSFTSTSQNPSTTATASGNYVVTVTDGGLLGSQCTASASTGLFTVNASPSVTTAIFSSGQCSTNSVDTAYAFASGGSGSGYTYAWTTASSPSGGSVTIANATNDTTALTSFNGFGSYTFKVVVTDAGNSCTANATTSAITYNLSTGPTITGMAAAATICNGTTVTLSPTVTGGTTYTQITPTTNYLESGHSGSFANSNAFDGNTATYFQSSASNGWVGVDLGSGQAGIQIAYVSIFPVAGQTASLNGAKIQVSSSNSFGTVTTIGTISSTPTAGVWTTVSTSGGANRYVRILGQNGTALYVAEIQFYKSSGTTSTSSYLWTASPTGNGLGATSTQSTTFSTTTAGSYTYTIKVTDANNCAAQASTGVQTVQSAISVSVISTKPNYCGTTDSVTLSAVASGGSGTYSSYAWTGSRTAGSFGTTTLDASTTTTGTNVANITSANTSTQFTYGVTVTDGNGCSSATSTDVLGVGTTPTISSVTASITKPCTGNTFSLSGAFSSGTSPYNYAWTGATGATIATSSGSTTTSPITTTATTSSAGNYAFGLLLVDANNCTASGSSAVTLIDTVPTVTLVSNKYTACSGTTINLTGTITYATTSPYTYAWTGSGVVNNTSSITTTAAPTTSGTYSVTVTDANGCTGTGTTTAVTVNTNPTVTVTPSSATSVCAGGSVSLTSTPSGGTSPYTYSWTGSGTITTVTSQNPTATPAATGTYSVTVTDANSCTATATTATVTVNANPTVTVTPSSGTSVCAGGTVSLTSTPSGGTSPYTYSWAGSGTINTTTSQNPTATPAATGTYTVTVKDSKNCTATGTTATVTVNANPTVTVTPSSATSVCAGGTVNLTSTPSGGTSPYSYSWTGSGTITTATSQNPTATPAATGTYSVTVKDANNCTVTGTTATVTVNTNPIVTVTPSSATSVCAGGTVSLTSTPSGGTSPYTYSWTGSGTITTTTSQNPTATPAATGTYSVTVKDANNCTVTGTTATVTVNANPTVTVGPSSATGVCAGGTVNLTSTPSGGTSPYTYSWTGSGTINTTTSQNPTATPAATGTYSVTVKDSKNCTVTGTTATVTVNANPTVTASSYAAALCAGTNTTVDTVYSAPSGGTGSYTYAWTVSPTGGMTTTASTSAKSAVTGGTNGTSYTFTITVTDGNSCTATANTSILRSANSGPKITNVPAAASICLGASKTYSPTYTAGTGALSTYLWTAAPTTGSGLTTTNTASTTVTPTAAGSYLYTTKVTDATGCAASATTGALTVNANPVPSISPTCGNTNGTEWVNLNEGSGVATSWFWTTTSGGRFYTSSALSVNSDGPTSTLQAPYVVYKGSYSVTITDANGCTGTGSFTITGTTCSVTLSADWLNFTAQKQGSSALLNWGVATENPGTRYEVQRSGDGTTWQALGSLPGHGSITAPAQYSFSDALPLTGVNYYRIKQVNANGGFDYSPVKALQFTGQWLVKIYPNPAQSYLVLEFNNNLDEKAAIVIQNELGSTIFSTQQQLVKGLNRITLNQVQPLAQGAYIINLITNENVYRSRFIKGGN